ncbi:unnamed protein product [Chilo suppressalis]|uniref:PDZ domain-containing protein n=1 Tax=Chilo suppressalis TaxID=168631 RepID=A0ABN8B0Z2_CHISP|nr:unnamed protein product [Chilo suppressalis]
MVPQQQRRRRRRAALTRTAERRLIVARGSGGFGFTIAGQRPCVVSAVAAGGPAERAGLRAGDALLTVDGANIARAPHASVARLVAAAPGAISLSVAPRESPPTDTEDTEPDERARTRRRHPPPRRRPQITHHPGCHAAPSTSGVNEILQNLRHAQLSSNHVARLECRAVVGYLGTIETPQAAATAAPGNVRTAVRKLRQERRPAAPVLLSVLPNALFLRRPTGQVLAQYPRERIVHAGCGSEADRRFFGLVTSAESQEAEASHSCHVFAVDPRMAEHEAHIPRAREFQVACTRDPVAERCLEFPPSAEYVVGVIRGMYSLPPEESSSPGLPPISKLAVKGDSPALGDFSRCNRAAFRLPRERRHGGRPDDDAADFVANSPQPSNHSEVTTTSSNSDSGIGFHNDCRNIADRILVVDFARAPAMNAFVREPLRRPVGLVGCGFDVDGSFLSNAFPVVDGFAGQGRPLNLDDVMLNANEPQPVRRANDDYDYNGRSGAVYDRVCSEGEGLYEALGTESVEIYEDRWGADGASVRSARSHEEPPRVRRHHLQASLDDMLVLRPRETKPEHDDDNFVHPASVRKSIKPLNILAKTKNMLSGRDRSRESRDGDTQEKQESCSNHENRVNKECSDNRDCRDARRRALSASCGEVCSVTADDGLAAAASKLNAIQ